MAVARRKRDRPRFHDPLLEILFQRGLDHETRYVQSLASAGRRVVDLAGTTDPSDAIARTLDAMHAGAEVIAQAARQRALPLPRAGAGRRLSHLSHLAEHGLAADSGRRTTNRDNIGRTNMPSWPPLPLLVSRFRQLALRTTEVWQGGLVRMPAWIAHPTDPDEPPYRPVAAVWISQRTGLLHVELSAEGAVASPDLALRALLSFGLKEAKGLDGRPAVVQVRDVELHEALTAALAGLGTVVELVEDVPAVREAMRVFEEASAEGGRFPGALEARGVTVDRLRSFADAAAQFYRAAPWQHLTDEDLIVVAAPPAPRGMRHFVVLGNAGHQFGLAFFDSRKAFERMFTSPSGEAMPRRAFGVTFGAIDELPFADVDAWEEHALPLSGPDAYPLAADLNLDGEVSRPDARALAHVEGLLRALALTTEDELDSGRWAKSVTTADGPTVFTLTLPRLLEGEEGGPVHSHGGATPLLAERASVRLARFFGERSFDNIDEANREIAAAQKRGLFEQSAEAAAGRALTPLEQAQELAYDAMEATGRRRIKLARRALALSEDCADAYVLLGEASPSAETAIEWFDRAVAAGARAVGPERFDALVGGFWHHLEARPYMRARLELAQTLFDIGRGAEALDHYRDLLRLNSEDNQGVRWLLLPALIAEGLDVEAGRLLKSYEGDAHAVWPYSEALLLFRAEGDSPSAREALANALRLNPHVRDLLLDPEGMPLDRPSHFSFGSLEEGALVAEALEEAFARTPRALDWLRARLSRGSRPRSSRRARPPSGRRRS